MQFQIMKWSNIVCVFLITGFIGCACRESTIPTRDLIVPAEPVVSVKRDIFQELSSDKSKVIDTNPEKPVAIVCSDTVNEKGYDYVRQSGYRLAIPQTRHVTNCLNYFLNRFRRDYLEGLENRRRYICMIRNKVVERNMPRAVKWIPMVESWFKHDAQSHAQAVGLWQLMPATAQSFGLRIDSWVDERKDPEKATTAALDFLEYLYERTGCWYLSFAAYHSGEGSVFRAIRNNGTEDYWELADNNEFSSYTRFYVAAIMALTLIERYCEDYGIVFPEDKPLEHVSFELQGQLDLRYFSKNVGIELDTLLKMNPSLKKSITPPDYPGFVLKVPVKQQSVVEKFLKNNDSGTGNRYAEYTIRPGDTLSAIATRYNISIDAIMVLNHLECHLILAGDSLLVPIL